MGLERTICVLHGRASPSTRPISSPASSPRSRSSPAAPYGAERGDHPGHPHRGRPHAHRHLHHRRRARRDALQRRPGLRAAPPHPPRRAPRHASSACPRALPPRSPRSSSTQYADVYPELHPQPRPHTSNSSTWRRAASSAPSKRACCEFEKVFGNIQKMVADALRASGRSFSDSFDPRGDRTAQADGSHRQQRRLHLPPHARDAGNHRRVQEIPRRHGDHHAASARKIERHISSSGVIDGRSAFKLYDTFGFPIEMTMRDGRRKGPRRWTRRASDERFKQHQETSHAGAEQRFKGGLADHQPRRPPSCTRPPTCCTPRCAGCWATRSRRRAPTSPPSACASTSASPAR